MRGLHLTADLYKCRCDEGLLRHAGELGPWCRQALQAVGLEPDHELFSDDDGHATVALLLTGSHICLHTWPGQRSASVDIYLSHGHADLSATARGLMQALVHRLQPEWTEQRSLDRGDGE